MVRKLKRYNRLKGLVGVILEYMKAPSPDKYEAIKGLGYKDVTIKMYIRTISIYLNSKDKRKGTPQSLFDIVDELRKPNTAYITPVKTRRTVDRHELKRVVSTELERIVPIMYEYQNEGADKILELCKPSIYKDSTIVRYIQGVRYYCKYRRSYHKCNSAIASIIDKIEANGDVVKPKYKEEIKNREPLPTIIAKYLLEHVNEDYRSCLDYVVNTLGYSLSVAKNYMYMFRKYIQSGTKVNKGYRSFYNYIEEHIKDYQIPVKEESPDEKRYNYLKRLVTSYINDNDLRLSSYNEKMDMSAISLYISKGIMSPILTEDDYIDINAIKYKIMKGKEEMKTKVEEKEKKKTRRRMGYLQFKEIAEFIKDNYENINSKVVVNSCPLPLNLREAKSLLSSLNHFLNKGTWGSYRVSHNWKNAVKDTFKVEVTDKEVAELAGEMVADKEVADETNVKVEQEPICHDSIDIDVNQEQESTHNVEGDTAGIKAGVIWNGFCSLLDNREQAIGFQKALKAFNVTDSRICRVTVEGSYDYEAIDEE